MSKKNNSELDKIRITAEIIEKDLRYSEAFYFILFKVRAPLAKVKSIQKNYSTLLKYSGWALDIAYLITLYKIFDKGQLSLGSLIKQIQDLSESNKLSFKMPDYTNFLAKANGYLRKIDTIEKKLNPLRNMFRAHNFPDRKCMLNINWYKTEKWLHWAENVFNDALSAMNYTPWYCFLEEDMVYEKNNFFKNIRKNISD